jgi:DNA-binding transcriptional regulator GbsR (MarR family)
MKLEEAKLQFIQTWGVLGSQWGINRTMAQVHALLLVSARPLSTDEVMEQLSISRGNANMNLRELMNWLLVEKTVIPGDRKEYYAAEKDMWRVATRIMYQRKKRELDPVVKALNALGKVEGDKSDPEWKTFTEVIGSVQKLAGQADKAMEVVIKAEENWFLGSFMKLFR